MCPTYSYNKVEWRHSTFFIVKLKCEVMIERKKKFSIGEKTFTVDFPNVGQLIDLESLKQALTSNKYGVMAQSGIRSMYYALDIVDTIAFFQVCVPSVSKYYDIKNYTTLPPDKVNELMEVYLKEIKPWFDSIMNELRGVKIDVNDSGEEGNS